MNGKFVAYYRVSTDKQGINGLGMDAQKESIQRYLNGGEWKLEAEFAEVETGKRRDRPELLKALELCRKTGATLLIAKLDRLARNAAFLLGLRDAGVDFVATDMPTANRLTVGILAVVAEHEREMISQRTREGLAQAKLRGVRLGNPNPGAALTKARESRVRIEEGYKAKLRPVILKIQEAKVTSLRGIANALNQRGILTITGKMFHAQTVKNIL